MLTVQVTTKTSHITMKEKNSYTQQHYEINIENAGCMYIGTESINYYSVANGFYNHSYSSSGEEPKFYEGGVRITKQTMQTMSSISIEDGYSLNLTQANIDVVRQAIATWLTSEGYADVQAACSVEDTTVAQSNFTAITGLINNNLNWVQNS